MNPIKVGRAKLGINGKQLSDIMNVSRQTISNWETNKSIPTVSQIMDLHYKLDIPLDELMNHFNKKN